MQNKKYNTNTVIDFNTFVQVHTMNQKIGYPDYLNDSVAVDQEYKRYVVFEKDYYRTKFQFYEMYQKDILERIRLPVDRERYNYTFTLL